MLARGEYSSAKQRRFLGARASGQPMRNPPPALKRAHATIEGAYLAALKRKDTKTLRALAKPWQAVEMALRGKNPGERIRVAPGSGGTYFVTVDGGAVTHPTTKAQAVKQAEELAALYGVKVQSIANPPASKSRAKHLVAYTLKEGAKTVGHVVARTAVAAAKEARAAGYELGRKVKTEYCKNPPPRGRVLSEEAHYIGYRHRSDGRKYDHQFSPGMRVVVSPDKKKVTLYRPDGRGVADDF